MGRPWPLLVCALAACALLFVPNATAQRKNRKIDRTPPAAPTGLTATAGNGQVALDWADNTESDLDHYNVYRGGTKVASTTSSAYTNTGLTNGTTYSYYVTAVDHAGNASAPSNTVTATPSSGTTGSPPPPSSGGADPSGQAMPVGDITGWHQIFADNFANETIPLGSFPAATNGKWGAYPDGWPDTSHNGTYSCTKVCSVANGLLDLYIHSENGVHYVAVPYPKLPAPYASAKNGHLYMRTAVRFKSDAIHCYKTAWLYWPDSGNWPTDGEIDFPEGDLDSTISGFVHHEGGTSGSDQDAFRTSATYTSWHTAVTEWTPSYVKFYLDGNLIGTSTSRLPNTSMHWVLQTETSLSGCVPTNTAQGHVSVDWATVYVPA